jgi:hypothetical protein
VLRDSLTKLEASELIDRLDGYAAARLEDEDDE